jgi:NO-binding membrane sensor protein with MHYT domain
MAEIHHFTYGWITPVLAYTLSVLGSVLGLTCAVHARKADSGAARAGWLTLAAFAIGGTGIWTMHFMAMLGFGVVGTDIRYDVLETAFSAVVAIVVVGVGLFIVGMGGSGRPAWWRILLGGLLAGLGVNAMHYMGMAAMRLNGVVTYDQALVAASIVIAVVAATVALWLCQTVRTGLAVFAAALVMGVAVNGMHFTGMAAMSVELGTDQSLTGATASALIVPIVLAVIFVVVGLVYAVLAAPTEEDKAAAAFLDSRMANRPPIVPEQRPAGEAGSLFNASMRSYQTRRR